MRRYSITRSTMEWNRIRNALLASTEPTEASDKLAFDIADLLAHDNGNTPQLPPDVKRQH